MKLLYLHQHFSTPAGAMGTRSYEFARRLVERGHQVTMVCGSYDVANTGLDGPFDAGKRRGFVDGIDVIEIEAPYSNSTAMFRRAIIFCQFAMRSTFVALTSDYDIQFATSTPLTIAVPAIIAKILRRKPFVFEVRDLWPELPRAMGVIRSRLLLWCMNALESCAYRSADACIGLAPGIVEGIRRKVPKKMIAMIPNGSDVVQDVSHVELTPEIESMLAARKGALKCIFSGAHGLANGLDALLDVAGELKRRGNKDIALILVGAGQMKPALIARARSEKLDHCVFLDPIPKAMLMALQSRVDVGLMILRNVPAFYRGTSPNKFFDYLACGLPVVINYPGWLADVLMRERCGVVAEPDNPSSLADHLEYLARSEIDRRTMGSRSRQLAETRFSHIELSRQFAEFLEGVASGKKGA
ncbi:MAG TPA: glycosyltransferase family 4 protein [Steroidobacteraceae bacterium]|nr:glycosyltransferase family 4 protein [Steroidobacteraceae bacterium]